MNTEMELLKTAVQNAADKGIRFGAPMEAGQLRAFGPIDQVLGDESLEDVFMDVVETHEATAAPAAPVRPSDAPQTPFS